MKSEEFDKIYKLENTHWWYVGMREICFSVLGRFLAPEKPLKILDIGCGVGGNLVELEKFGDAQGIDLDPHAVELCRTNGHRCAVGDLTALGLEKDSYALITLFDVLNHIDVGRVRKILGDLKAGLKPNGLLALREPAIRLVGGRHDLDVNIHFRLDKQQAVKLLEEAGFKVLYASYINFLLFIPILIKRRLDLLSDSSPKSDVYEHNAVVNAALLAVLRLEKTLLKFVPQPFGVSLFVVATVS